MHVGVTFPQTEWLPAVPFAATHVSVNTMGAGLTGVEGHLGALAAAAEAWFKG